MIPLGITSYRRDWGALCDAATLLGVPRDPLSQAAHEALTRAGMRGKRFRAWVAGGGAAVVLGDINDPVAFNAVACGVETSEVLNKTPVRETQVVRDAPPQIRADVADALAEAYTAAVASDKAALREASETPSLPRKRKVTTPPRLDPCVPTTDTAGERDSRTARFKLRAVRAARVLQLAVRRRDPRQPDVALQLRQLPGRARTLLQRPRAHARHGEQRG